MEVGRALSLPVTYGRWVGLILNSVYKAIGFFKFRIIAYYLRALLGSDPKAKKPLENPPENSPENQLEISYTGKSPKIGSLDMS